ncbi:MAG: DUF4838 domain-containing protein [Firmicutes bacterium]|nr:DUF4838 domain-containing protein [Bacillota bacterium]
MKKLRFTAAFLALTAAAAGCAVSCGVKETKPDEEVIPRVYDSEVFGGAAVKKLTIDGKNIGDYKIVIPDEATESEKYAAEELKKYIQRATGTELEIKIGGTSERMISVKNSGEGKEESFSIVSDGKGVLTISGGGDRGTIYGVYEFLEKYVGWRFLAQDYDVIYPADKIELKNLSDTQSPRFDWRDSYWKPYFDPDISVKRRINSNNHKMSDAQGGGIGFTGQFVHTFARATGVKTQPCLSDPETYEKVIAWVQDLLDENPDAYMISVSQNDNYEYCKCEKCAAVDEEEGSPAGSLIRFVNKVADHFSEKYPNLLIHTLAYQYTRTAPKITKPRDNVVIQLCSIECCANHALGDPTCEANQRFVKDIEEWNKISNHLIIWDYLLNWGLSGYMAQLPNIDLIGENIKFFSKYKVSGLFSQGEYRGSDFGFNCMRAYLSAKSQWNPDMTDEEYEEWKLDFLKGYYGDGWKNVKRYLDFYLSCHTSEDHFGSPSDASVIVSKEQALSISGELGGLISDLYAKAENDAIRDHVERFQLFTDYFDLQYLDNEIAFMEDKEERDALREEWNKRNQNLLKRIVELQIATVEHTPITEYIESLTKLPPFEWSKN